MAKFNSEIYKVKGIWIQDETKPAMTGFYYQDERGRHFIVNDADFQHYKTTPYLLCRNTGIELKDSSYIPYENDVMQYTEPMNDKVRFGYLEFNQLRKCWGLITSSETRQFRPLDKCCKLAYTGRNILVSDEDMEWFEEYSRQEYEKSKSHVIDNSYCPSKFKK